jgi:AbrB family looped-hinge helix DNA binding protein
MKIHTNHKKSIIMEAENGKYIFGVVKVGERGQIVIPKEAREIYGIKAGDSLLVLGDMKGMAVIKTEIFQDKIDEMLGGN